MMSIQTLWAELLQLNQSTKSIFKTKEAVTTPKQESLTPHSPSTIGAPAPPSLTAAPKFPLASTTTTLQPWIQTTRVKRPSTSSTTSFPKLRPPLRVAWKVRYTTINQFLLECTIVLLTTQVVWRLRGHPRTISRRLPQKEIIMESTWWIS